MPTEEIEFMGTERVQIAVNIDGGTVNIEVGYKPNEYARFIPEQMVIEAMPGAVNLIERSQHKISFGAVTRHFWFNVPIVAQPGTPFTIRLSTAGACNGWFKFGGLQCGADHGRSVEQTYNARLNGNLELVGERVISPK